MWVSPHVGCGWNKASNFNNGVKPKYLTRTSIVSNFNTGDLNFSYLIMWVPPTPHRTDKPRHSSLIAWYFILRLIFLRTTFYVSAFPKIPVQSARYDECRCELTCLLLGGEISNWHLAPRKHPSSIIYQHLRYTTLHLTQVTISR